MKGLLYLCQQNPWLLDGGALIRNYWLVKALSKRYDVHLVTAGDTCDAIPADFAAACASISRFPRPESGALGFRALQALRPRSAYFLSGSVTPEMRAFVAKEARAGTYAFAMLDIQMLDAVDGTGVPIVYNAHNTEYKLLERRGEIEKSMLARAFVRLDAARLKPTERRVTRDAIETIACSADDAQELLALAPEARGKMFIVPNGVDIERYARTYATPPQAEPMTLLITGRFDWQPNRVGLNWFIAEVLPALRVCLKKGTFEVRISGRMSLELETELRALPYVVPIRNPPDMRAELARARVVGAAILASSGTRLRILEAWAAGRPVVTTPAGAFGLPHTSGEELFAVDGATAFASSVERLFTDDALYDSMRSKALARAGAFDWRKIGNSFLSESQGLLP